MPEEEAGAEFEAEIAKMKADMVAAYHAHDEAFREASQKVVAAALVELYVWLLARYEPPDKSKMN